MGKIFIVFCCFMLCFFALRAAVLQGYGDVEHCYKYPNKSITTCDGSDYASFESLWGRRDLNFCYISSLGCNMPVVMENVVAYEDEEYWYEYYTRYEVLDDIITKEQWIAQGKPQAQVFCRMVYPYVGRWYIKSSFGNEMNPFDYGRDYCNLFAYGLSYSCFQEPDKADDPCWDDFDGGLFYEYEEEQTLLSIVFAPPVVKTPCAVVGINKLMISTGDAFQLYAGKYTEPALVLQYNGEKCYLQLVSGRGRLNVMVGDRVYHAVE